jgi:hypothetical protein
MLYDEQELTQMTDEVLAEHLEKITRRTGTLVCIFEELRLEKQQLDAELERRCQYYSTEPEEG